MLGKGRWSLKVVAYLQDVTRCIYELDPPTKVVWNQGFAITSTLTDSSDISQDVFSTSQQSLVLGAITENPRKGQKGRSSTGHKPLIASFRDEPIPYGSSIGSFNHIISN